MSLFTRRIHACQLSQTLNRPARTVRPPRPQASWCHRPAWHKGRQEAGQRAQVRRDGRSVRPRGADRQSGGQEAL